MEPQERRVRRVCVYCGSKAGGNPAYGEAAALLGKEMVRRGMDLVYGGGTVGLMGIVAKSVLEGGGHVLGVIPAALTPREVAGEFVGEVKVVKDMHERKAAMAKAADAFIALPGGFGTFEELLEMVTWSQLGIHAKPVAVLNIAGYYDSLLTFFDHSVKEGFVSAQNRAAVLSSASITELLDQISEYEASHPSIVAKESWELGYLVLNGNNDVSASTGTEETK